MINHRAHIREMLTQLGCVDSTPVPTESGLLGGRVNTLGTSDLVTTSRKSADFKILSDRHVLRLLGDYFLDQPPLLQTVKSLLQDTC